MVEPGELTEASEHWRAVEADGPAQFAWVREPRPPGPAAILLGAFDPPTVAHAAILAKASEATNLPGAFCLTKVLLGRPDDRLLEPEQRLELLVLVAARHDFGLAIANRGTYLGVARVAPSGSAFVVGSDKLAQIRDPVFYPDGEAGVRATLDEVRFVVVERGGPPAELPENAVRIDAASQVSASEVRRRLRRGMTVGDLVSPEVSAWLRRYTVPPDATEGPSKGR